MNTEDKQLLHQCILTLNDILFREEQAQQTPKQPAKGIFKLHVLTDSEKYETALQKQKAESATRQMNIDNLMPKHEKETKKKEDFELAKKEMKEMPPKYSDGSFRVRNKNTELLEYRFMHEGEQIPVYGYSKNECWDKRTDFITGKAQKSKKIIFTLGDWLLKWYSIYKIRKDGTRINPDNESYIKNAINPKLGKIPLKRLKGVQIQEFLKEYDDRTNTRKKISDLLNSALKSAVANELIKVNPCVAIAIEKHKSKKYPVIQPSDFNKLLLHIKNPKYLALFWFSCATGLRIGEVIASVSYIDYEKGTIDVQGDDTVTKNHKRQVPFLPTLLTLDQRELLKGLKYPGASQYFRKTFKKLGIPAVIHSFRHTFISYCYHVGFKDKQIQEWAGHGTISMTLDTYTHIIPNESSPLIDYLKALKEHLGL